MIAYLISDHVHVLPMQEEIKYRFVTTCKFLHSKQTFVKKVETKNEPEWWRWFNTKSLAVDYIKNINT